MCLLEAAAAAAIAAAGAAATAEVAMAEAAEEAAVVGKEEVPAEEKDRLRDPRVRLVVSCLRASVRRPPGCLLQCT